MQELSVRGLALRVLILIGALLLVAGIASPALAHAERAGSSPKEGEELSEVPTELTISFTEPPAGNANLSVLDGCGDEVVASRDVSNLEIIAALNEGQPGKWKVSTSLVSGLDGHPTKDRWTFRVAGAPDCSAEAAATPVPPDEESGEGVPSVIIIGVVAGVALVGITFLVRSGRG